MDKERPGFPAVASQILARELAQAKTHVEGSIDGGDPEELHDLRVAIRRTRAALRLFERAFPVAAAALGPARAGLKETGAVLGRARDLDVQIGRLQAWLDETGRSHDPSARRAIRLLQQERVVARRALRSHLEGHLFEERLEAVRDAAVAVARAPVRRGPVRLLRRPIRQVQFGVGQARVHPSDPIAFHALRIDVKRLRYALEFLGPTLPFQVEKAIRRLRAAQEALGDLQDASVEQAVAIRLIGRAGNDRTVCRLLQSYQQDQARVQATQLAVCGEMLEEIERGAAALRGRLKGP